MSDETENKGYNKPRAGEDDWHVPLNENFDQIDADIYDIEQRLENGSGEGSTARFGRFVHEPTNAPVEGSIVEDHGSGTLDHWDGDTEPFEIISSDTIVGEHSVRLDHPGGEESYGYQMGTETVTTRRGEVYSCFVRFDEIDERNQSGLTVCGEWDEDGIVQGYLARLEEDGDLQILKYADGEFVESSDSSSIDLETGVRYRIEIELGWDDTTARAFNVDDDELASTTWEGETELTSGGAGYGGRWANGSDGETVTFDHITRKSLDASPARVAGSASSGSIETGGYKEWDVLITESDGNYEIIDAFGEGIGSTGDAPSALQAATDATPYGGTLVVKGHYPYEDGDEWHVEEAIRILGHGATIDASPMSSSMHDEHFIFVGNDRGSSYDVDDISIASSKKPKIEFDDDVDGDIQYNDVLYFSSSETYDSDQSGGNNPRQKGELHLVAETPTSPFDNADTSDASLSDDEVTVMDPLVFDYDDLGDLSVRHYRNHKITIEGFDVIGPDIWEPAVGAFRVVGLSECRLRDLTIREMGYEAITFRAVYAGRVQDCEIAYGASNVDGGDGYGVKLADGAAYCSVENTTFHWCRHGIAFSSGRPRRNCTVKDCTFTYSRSTALDMHGEDLRHRIINCTFAFGHDEAMSYGNDTIVRGCTFDMMGEEDGIYKSGSRTPPFGAGLVVSNCVFRNFDRAVRVDDDDSDFNELVINGCKFYKGDDHVFRVRDITLPNLVFAGNLVKDVPEGFVNRGEISSGTVTGNHFVDCGTCLDPEDEGGDTLNFTVSGNTAKDCDEFIACDSDDEDWVVMNNHMIGGDTFIDGSGGGDWVVDRNVIRGASEGWTGDDGSNFTY